MTGKNIGFTVVRGPKRSDYRDVLADPDTICGKVSATLEGQTTEVCLEGEAWGSARG